MVKTMFEDLDMVIDDIISTYEYIQKYHLEESDYLSLEAYQKYGKHSDQLTDLSPSGIINYFQATMLANVPTQRDVYVRDIRYVSNILGTIDFTPDEFDRYSRYYSEDIAAFFDTWDSALSIALPEYRKSRPSGNSEAQTHNNKRKSISPRQRYKVLTRDGFRCVLCGAAPKDSLDIQLHVDHIVPVSKGGTNSLDNLRILCSECNLGKGDLMIEPELSFE